MGNGKNGRQARRKQKRKKRNILFHNEAESVKRNMEDISLCPSCWEEPIKKDQDEEE